MRRLYIYLLSPVLLCGGCGRLGYDAIVGAPSSLADAAPSTGGPDAPGASGTGLVDAAPGPSDGGAGGGSGPMVDGVAPALGSVGDGHDAGMASDGPPPPDAVPAVPRVLTGSYVGDGTGQRFVGGLPFRPSVVLVRAFASAPTLLRTATMAGNASKDLGARAPLAPELVQALSNGGFEVGLGANESGRTYHYAAFSPSPYVQVGTYTGAANAVTVRLGFAAGYLLIVSGEGWPHLRSRTMPGAAGVYGFAHPGLALTADGFEVAAAADINTSGATHHYVAWSAADPSTMTGSYIGDGLDVRAIGTRLSPEALLVQCGSARREVGYEYAAALWRPASLPAAMDRTLALGSTPPYLPGHIRRLLPAGFEIGPQEPVNAAGQTCHFVAFGR